MKRLVMLVALGVLLLVGGSVGAQSGVGEPVDYLGAIPECTEDDLAIVMEAVDIVSFDIEQLTSYALENDVNNALRAAETMVSTWRVLREGLPSCALAVHTDRMISDLAYTGNLTMAYIKLGDADAETYLDYYLGHAQEIQDFGAWLLGAEG